MLVPLSDGNMVNFPDLSDGREARLECKMEKSGYWVLWPVLSGQA